MFAGLTVAIAAVALGGTGCQSVSSTRSAMMNAVGLSKTSLPPTQFLCLVDPNLQQMPDPTRNGAPSSALVGKAYLFGADNKPADADGQLVVMMHDTTPRPAGVLPKVPEMVHIDPATMKKLVAHDERFGKHYAFPIPWPENWSDVTHVTLQARFSPNKEKFKDLKDLFNPETRLAVNSGTPTIYDKATGQPLVPGSQPSAIPASGTIAGPAGVPDPNQAAFKQMLNGNGMSLASSPPSSPSPASTFGMPPVQQTSGFNVPTGNFTPPTTTVGPNGSKITSGAWAMPAPGQPGAMPNLGTPPSSFGPPSMPTIPPPPSANFQAGGVTQPGMPIMPNLPVTPASKSLPFPPPVGPPLPPVGPIGELRPEGGLQPVVIRRQ